MIELTPGRDGVKLGDLTISFMRTIRIPDDGRQHSLPPGLGQFPVRRVEDYADRVPAEWRKHGGVFMPIHEREAMWMSFSAASHKPVALKVLMGMVNGLTGKPYSEGLVGGKKQDYLVAPTQPWLDGIKTEGDSIRQFVAVPLGKGYSVEGQVTGQEKYGGLQLIGYNAKPGIFPEPQILRSLAFSESDDILSDSDDMMFASAMPESSAMPASAKYSGLPNMERQVRRRSAKKPDMGLGAGGRMKQKVYDDPHGIATWDLESQTRCFVHLCNAQQWLEITGEVAPPLPPQAQHYYGMYYDVDDKNTSGIDGSDILDNVKTVDEMAKQKGKYLPKDTKPNNPTIIVNPYPPKSPFEVQDGQWPTPDYPGTDDNSMF